jgi:hypothetical protein
MTRNVEIQSLCGCLTELLDYGPGDVIETCELGISEDCEEGAVVLLRSAFWDPRMARRYCFCCQPCLEQHAAECRAYHGLHKEER